MPFNFVPGWSPEHAMRAQARLDATGRFCTVAQPTKPHRPAVSLGRYRLNYYEQGQAGTCYLHAAKQLAEVTAKAKGYSPYSICRRLLGWATMQMEGGGNPADGGSPTDSVVTMTKTGVGIAHEELLPYTDDRDILDRKPPEAVFADAKQSHLIAPVRVKSVDEVISLIDAGHPVANGYPCPAAMQEPEPILDRIDPDILGGHAQLIWGYIDKGVIDGHRYLELENWWSTIYRPLPASVAKLVDGYEPVTATKTTSKWIREDVYLYYCNLWRQVEHVSATDLDGLIRGVVQGSPSFTDGFV